MSNKDDKDNDKELGRKLFRVMQAEKHSSDQSSKANMAALGFVILLVGLGLLGYFLYLSGAF